MWRFGWVFFLIALFFEVLAFLAGFLALCSRLGSAFTGLLSLVALFFLTIAVSLMTYVLSPYPYSHFDNRSKLTVRRQRHLREDAQLVRQRRPRRLDRPVRLWLRLGLLGRAAHQHGALLPRPAQAQGQGHYRCWCWCCFADDDGDEWPHVPPGLALEQTHRQPAVV
jgi:hypothetical protein